jgi:DNA-binding NtrC family response regulator
MINGNSQNSQKIAVLLVMAPESPGFEGILSCLETLDFELAAVSDCRGIRRQLRAANPSVVITGVTLCDGNWCDVLSYIVQCEAGASLVVYSCEIDERLRSEAIARGAYDLISSPLSAPQLRRCIEEAHCFGREVQRTRAVGGGPSAAECWSSRTL